MNQGNGPARTRIATSGKVALGAALAVAGIVATHQRAAADQLDAVLQRLDALEKSNAKLQNENARLRDRVQRVEGGRGVPAAVAAPGAHPAGPAAPGAPPTNAYGSAGPVKAPAGIGWFDADGHGFFERKPGKPLTFYVPGGEITAYGNLDVSFDDTSKNVKSGLVGLGGPTDVPAGNFGWMPAISTNLSYFGVRGFQRIPDMPFNFVWQAEAGFDISASPGLRETNSNLSQNVNGALFSRNTYIGLSSAEYGAVKIGKTTGPYQNSTAAFNPFAGQIGDYSVVMGNSGGDNRVEFGTRLNHAIWYESPTFAGFQLNALFSPGQNRSDTSDNLPAGESDCAGGNIPGSGGTFPVACNDGAFSNAISANLSYTNGPFYATAAYERHFKVNRQSDILAIYGMGNPLVGGNPIFPSATALQLFNEDVADEDAFKVGALYRFPTKTTIGGIFESLHRYVPADLAFQNERQRYGTWLFLSQELTDKDSIHFGWAHAFKTPGDPGQHNDGTLTNDNGLTAFAPNNNQADMVTGSWKHKFSENLTWYSAVAATFNGPSAHFDLGAGGRGITTDCHDATGSDGGNVFGGPRCWTGTTIVGVSTGLQYRF